MKVDIKLEDISKLRALDKEADEYFDKEEWTLDDLIDQSEILKDVLRIVGTIIYIQDA